MRRARRLLTGWGRTAPTAADVVRPATVEGVAAAVAAAGPRGVIARGLGRSYGDPAQCAGGSVIDLTALAGVTGFDPEERTVTVRAGTSLDALARWLVPRGWFAPVLPGTPFVTVGGAVAADIHGKNHHRDGSFSRHVTALTLLTGAGELLTLDPAGDPDAFWATAGGMGLTGVILEVTLRVVPIETSRIRVDTERAADLDHAMASMAAGDAGYAYSVAWIDLVARGRSTGRSVLTRGDHATLADLRGGARDDPLAYRRPPSAPAPPWAPPGLLNRMTVRAFNELWFRRSPKARRRETQSIPRFFFPLEIVDGWNRLYGPRGLVQYQFVVPFGAEETLRRCVLRLSAAGFPSFLAVLKRFGPGSPGPLSFPLPGWTLALDVPGGSTELHGLLDGLDELVAEAGGRVYLAKDSRLRPELMDAMYPRLPEWREVRARLDPGGRFRSDLARRLGL